jgi:hypothetical protein
MTQFKESRNAAQIPEDCRLENYACDAASTLMAQEYHLIVTLAPRELGRPNGIL